MNLPDETKFQSKTLIERTSLPWRFNHRLQTRKFEFLCESGRFERIFKRIASERSRVKSIEVKLGIRVFDLESERELSCMARTMSLNKVGFNGGVVKLGFLLLFLLLLWLYG